MTDRSGMIRPIYSQANLLRKSTRKLRPVTIQHGPITRLLGRPGGTGAMADLDHLPPTSSQQSESLLHHTGRVLGSPWDWWAVEGILTPKCDTVKPILSEYLVITARIVL